MACSALQVRAHALEVMAERGPRGLDDALQVGGPAPRLIPGAQQAVAALFHLGPRRAQALAPVEDALLAAPVEAVAQHGHVPFLRARERRQQEGGLLLEGERGSFRSGVGSSQRSRRSASEDACARRSSCTASTRAIRSAASPWRSSQRWRKSSAACIAAVSSASSADVRSATDGSRSVSRRRALNR